LKCRPWDAGGAKDDLGIGDAGISNQRDSFAQKVCDGDLFGFTGADVRNGQ